MQMIFISLSVFLKVKDYFPACVEKCLKQDESKYSNVMVIVRKADLCNKKTRIPELILSSVIRVFNCCRCAAPYDHDI